MTPRAAAALLALCLVACSEPTPPSLTEQRLADLELLVLNRGESIEEFWALCVQAEDPQRALDLYDRLAEKGADTTRRRLGLQLAEPLIEARRYDDFLDGQSWGPNELDLALWSLWQAEKLAGEEDAERRQRLERSARRRVLAAGGRRLEAHAALGQEAEAWAVVDQVVEHAPPAGAYAVLIEHARRAGDPELAAALDARAEDAEGR